MIIRIDNYPHGDLWAYNRLLADPLYDHREHLYHFLRSFEQGGIGYVLGVSPGLINATSDLFFLQSLEFAEIAIHGFTHGWDEYAECWQAVAESWPHGGEFARASQKQIREKLVRALDVLSAFSIKKFIAPFNVYTQALLEVLNEFEFEMIMGGAQTLTHDMDRLDHGDLKLDICLPPFWGPSCQILQHLPRAIEGNKTIGLQWTDEKPANVNCWQQIAEIIGSRRGDGKLAANEASPMTAEKDLPVSSTVGAKLMTDLPIAIVTETMNYISGGVRCIAEVLNRLQARGYDVACYVTQPDLRCEWLDVAFPILPAARLGDFKGIAICPYSPTAKMVARCPAEAKFYWVHSYEPEFPRLTGRSDNWRKMSEDSYRLDELQYFAVSSYVKMILELIYKRKTLSPLVPGGVDTSLFVPGKKAGRPLRLMFLSREHAFRGADDIVKALQIVRQHGVEFEVWVMGRPLELDGIAHRRVAPLPQKQFAALLGSVDIFVHASRFEGFGLPPLEAMACRCAVIATYVGASDYLLDGYNALVVPPQRPDKIAAALLRLAGDEDLRTKLGQGGLETVNGGYTWEHTVDRLLEALAEGLENTQSAVPTVRPDMSIAHRKGEVARALVPQEKTGALNSSPAQALLVSAIVSTYNSERFMRGCLEDLLGQTIGDRLEIIVIDSGSRENEGEIVRKFQQQFKNIRYIRTEHRQSLYAAWNRGIRAAAGKYITSANTDDRHAAHAFERMARVLDERPDIALVYANVWVTETENETFERFTPVGQLKWKDFDPRQLIEGCFIGPQPMWRRSMHEKYGYFDESFESAGDWEFWLRISRKETFFHLDEFLGLYLKAPASIEHRNRQLSVREAGRIRRQYCGSIPPAAEMPALEATGE